MKLLLIIDCNSLCHIAKHSTKSFSFRGVKTGVIFGFFYMLLGIVEKFNPEYIAFCWDSPKEKLKRKKIDPNYKVPKVELFDEGKKFLNEIAYPQFNKLREKILPDFGFKNIFYQVGYEADDLIAATCKNNHLVDKIIVSRDNDLWQLLRSDCSFYDPIKKTVFTSEDFLKIYEISPRTWVGVLSIAGCSGDGVKGVSGIGIGKAVQYLTGKMKPNSKGLEKIESQQKQILKNLFLVDLPFDKEIMDCMIERDSVSEGISSEKFVEFCNEYGFKKFLQEMSRWKKVFRMI